MAFGEVYVYDNAGIWLASITDGSKTAPSAATTWRNISGYVAKAMVAINWVETATPHTFGVSGAVRAVSQHYDVAVTLDLVTDSYKAVGAQNQARGPDGLNEIFRRHMRPPLGSGTADTNSGFARIHIAPNSGSTFAPPALPTVVATPPNASANKPTFVGNIVISSWEPFGEGNVGELVRQSRTFNGTGEWQWTTT